MSEIAALVLAAGRGTRFGAGPADSKVTAVLAGRSLVRRVAETALASVARPVIVVTGHAEAAVHDALAGLPVTLVHNAAYADGLASSLKAGLAAVGATCEGAIVLLADMPLVRTRTIDRLARALSQRPRPDALVPTWDGRRGNPVLLARGLFAEVERLEGDEGARRLLADTGRRVLKVEVDDPGIVVDIDTPQALAAVDDLGGRAPRSG